LFREGGVHRGDQSPGIAERAIALHATESGCAVAFTTISAESIDTRIEVRRGRQIHAGDVQGGAGRPDAAARVIRLYGVERGEAVAGAAGGINESSGASGARQERAGGGHGGHGGPEG